MKKTWQPKQIKLDQKGIVKILGEREAQVMEVLWRREEASVRDVCGELCKSREYSFNTIMTIMNRLASKGLLKKRVLRGIYCYRPLLSRKEFIKTAASRVIASLFSDTEVFNQSSLSAALQCLSASQRRAFVRMVKKIVITHLK